MIQLRTLLLTLRIAPGRANLISLLYLVSLPLNTQLTYSALQLCLIGER